MKIVVSLEVWSDENKTISHCYKRAINLSFGCGKDYANEQISILSSEIGRIGDLMHDAYTEGKDLKEVNVDQ